MKLSVCTRKGKQGFRRAGYDFNPNPTIIETDDLSVIEQIKGEAMLEVTELEDDTPIPVAKPALPVKKIKAKKTKK